MWILRSNDEAEGGPYTFRMTPGRVRTLGRGPRADFVLDAALVSRAHCRLVGADNELVVENLSSTNGTFVNDRQVELQRNSSLTVAGIAVLNSCALCSLE